MSDLYELLAPHFDGLETTSSPPKRPSSANPATTSYLNRLSTLSLSDLTTTEPASLLHAAQSHLRNLQALSKRSHKAVIASASHFGNLTSLVPTLATHATELHDGLPELETAATEFARKYDRSQENAALDRRKQAMLLSRNVDRVLDVLELPTLLSSTVSAAQAPTTTNASSPAHSYASALDLHSHIKRLNGLYPHSALVADVTKQAEVEIANLTSILITSLQSPSLKLAAAMRTIGWLRRVAPDLADDGHASHKSTALSTKSLDFSTGPANADGTLGALFLVCRLRTLQSTLDALEPLRDLADQETARREQAGGGADAKQAPPTSSALGSQSERYLKRYIEIFREQSFAISSMYTSIFPAGLPRVDGGREKNAPNGGGDDALLSLPSPLASFGLHLVDLLTATLREYMPNIHEAPTRESLLTQVLYCASSLGRLGADFSLVIALLEDEITGRAQTAEEDAEWVQVMQKHRVQAGRLELLARGVGSGRIGSATLQSPTALPAG